MDKISAENLIECSNLDQTELREKENSKIVNEEDLNCEDSNEPAYKDYALRQAKMQVQLTEFDTELIRKQQLHQKMLDNVKGEYTIDSKMQDLTNKIESLEKEMKDLLDLISTADTK